MTIEKVTITKTLWVLITGAFLWMAGQTYQTYGIRSGQKAILDEHERRITKAEADLGILRNRVIEILVKLAGIEKGADNAKRSEAAITTTDRTDAREPTDGGPPRLRLSMAEIPRLGAYHVRTSALPTLSEEGDHHRLPSPRPHRTSERRERSAFLAALESSRLLQFLPLDQDHDRGPGPGPNKETLNIQDRGGSFLGRPF